MQLWGSKDAIISLVECFVSSQLITSSSQSSVKIWWEEGAPPTLTIPNSADYQLLSSSLSCLLTMILWYIDQWSVSVAMFECRQCGDQCQSWHQLIPARNILSTTWSTPIIDPLLVYCKTVSTNFFFKWSYSSNVKLQEYKLIIKANGFKNGERDSDILFNTLVLWPLFRVKFMTATKWN